MPGRKGRSWTSGRDRPMFFGMFIFCSLAVLMRTSTARSPECVSYSPQTCLFGDVKLRHRGCKPIPCSFDVLDEMNGCTFPESGEFRYREAGDCEDPFMTTEKGRLEACGGERCCRGDHRGDFKVKGKAPGGKYDRHVFEPEDSTCRYAEVGRGQILHYLRSRNSPIVVAGDSMMRQFFLRLVTMIRGQVRMVDYQRHVHAMYAVCREADVFRISTHNKNSTARASDQHHLNEIIGPFFGVREGPGTLMAQETMKKCTRAPALLHFLHLPQYPSQTKGLLRYLYQTPAMFTKPVYLVSVSYWEFGDKPTKNYLEALDKIAETARKVIVMSTPTVRVVDDDYRRNLTRRNEVMENWVMARRETHPGKFLFLDYDAISLAANPPPGGAENNWHYMCSTLWTRHFTIDQSSKGMDEVGEPIHQLDQGEISRIVATEDGACGDEMNRMLWQVVFNMLL